MSPRAAAGRGLLLLYPLAWRRRYGDEMTALLEDDPPSARGLATLVTGALRAHARPGPWRTCASSVERMRLSLWAVFCCWIVLSVAGAAFQKETEHQHLSLAGPFHGAFGVARGLVIAGAVLGAAAIAAGGLPLLWQSLRQARGGGAVLRASLVLPVAALLLFAVVTRLVLALEPESLAGTSIGVRLALVLPWWAAGAAFALSCALAPRMVLARVEASPASLRRASYAGLAVLSAMALVTAGLAVYGLGLLRLDPSVWSASAGPLWASTPLVVSGGAVLAATATALAGVSATRAFAAARA
jgi:hypothetical protein